MEIKIDQCFLVRGYADNWGNTLRLSTTSSFNCVDFFRQFDFPFVVIRIHYICVDSTAFWSTSTAVCHVRGLAVAYSAPLGGSTPPRLCVRKLTLKIRDFVDISNTLRRSQQYSGARHRALAVVDLVCIDYIHVDHNCVCFVYKAK
jgi:hypothetical protein